MKIITLLAISVFFSSSTLLAQTSQISVGAPGTVQVFYDTKFDPSDGSIINVGFTGSSSTGNDLLLVKLSSTQNIIWQKTIANTGDDFFSKVIVCSNGDYVAIGQIYQSGIRRGIVCRINPINGGIIWTSVSSNSSVGELFNDVVETVNQNIAVAGYDSYLAPQTNCFIALLNSSGTKIWSYLSTRSNSDGFQAITQLPNNNLIVGGIYIETSGNYSAAILEMNESNGSIISQNTYNVLTSVPGDVYTLNSLLPNKFYIKNNSVLLDVQYFEGYGYGSKHGLLVYDQSTKNLSGNIFYHSATDVASGFSLCPISNNDYLVINTYSTPQTAYISRITNGVLAFNRQINNSLNTVIYGADIMGTKTTFSGSTIIADNDGYNLFSSYDVPASTIPCNIINNNTLNLQPESVTANSQNALVFVPGGNIINAALVTQTPSYTINNVCGFVMPVQLVNFTANYRVDDVSTLLNWNTSSELNSSKFIIERSVDNGRHFTAIGSVNAAGTSNTLRQYNFIDIKPGQGINLYRLKQIDINGSFKYSDIRSINCLRGKDNNYILSPVPAHNFTWLTFTGEKSQTIKIAVLDAAGKLIRNQNATIDNTHLLKLDLSGCNTGIYFIKIYTEGLNTIVKKIIIE